MTKCSPTKELSHWPTVVMLVQNIYLKCFEIKNDDVFVVTFPLSGTLWTQRIITLIHAEDFPDTDKQLTCKQMPWLEYQTMHNNYNTRPSPRLFCSYLLQQLMPKMLQKKKKKSVIYVIRNPKDVMVSYFHFSNNKKNLDSSKNFDEMLEKFFTGFTLSAHLHLPVDQQLPDRQTAVSEAWKILIQHPRTTSTGAPQGCVLYTNDCTSKDTSVKLLKFVDDTTIIGLIQDSDESAYRQEVKELAELCSLNNLELNMLKIVEVTVDFRSNPPALHPLTIMDSTVVTVESFRFLGTTISQDLKWDTHIESIVK
ncbi:cytosolic sulfotransferase 12-like [Puntigrus tetrazona]|uniref:cytosolic sulfotransferase 12-like n=1 Tax=Puntigrus tetrazona TaxID=1606681 RepID=UPI001C8A1D20|nr:cytosolic sulfotransferase 12-like [Puntigrus tetrazona]